MSSLGAFGMQIEEIVRAAMVCQGARNSVRPQLDGNTKPTRKTGFGGRWQATFAGRQHVIRAFWSGNIMSA